MDKLGITEEILLSVLEGESVEVRVNSDCLSVRLVLEVSDFVLSKSLPLCSVCCCICRLVGVPVESMNKGNFYKELNKCKCERQKLQKSSGRDGGVSLNGFLISL